MKKVLALLMTISLASGAFAQSALTGLSAAFQEFTTELNPALPVNSTIGTPWSDAYIGGFPHLGVGLAVGATTIPSGVIDKVTGAIGVDTSTVPGFSYVEQYGLPIPAAALTARLGGFVLPFDIGAKFGTIPAQLKDKMAQVLPAGTELNYLLAGADVRYALLKENDGFIDLVAGAGMDYLDGDVSLPVSQVEQSYTFSVPNGSGGTDSHVIALTDPRLTMSWQTLTADFTVQASKRILFLTPYAGAGISFGKPSLVTGLSAVTTLDGKAVSQADIDTIKKAYTDYGQAYPAELDDFSATGYTYSAAITDWWSGMDYRLFGGVSLDLLIVHLDITGSYNFIGKNLGATVGLRVQL